VDAEDARIAAGEGVDAIVVFNHGGRQLDGAPAVIRILPNIVEAVAGESEVLFDGGITSGQSLLKTLALGARAGLIGQAFLYGLGAMGQAGVAKAIEVIRKELDVSMGLTARHDVQSISREILLQRNGQPYGAR